MMNNLRVFVYGTLKPGESNYDRYCAGKVVDVKDAIAFGQLFALPMGYPAMIPGDRPVRGVLLTFADPQVLEALDQLEGYQSQRPAEENEYNRQLIEIFNEAGDALGTAWTYLMRAKQVEWLGGTFLPTGCWSGQNSDRMLLHQ